MHAQFDDINLPAATMSRILLVHWNEKEAEERARAIEDHGHKVRTLFDSAKEHLKLVRNFPPELLVIDLTRLPSQGREVAAHFRRLKSTREVPILFVNGDAERVARTRKLIPDADFAKSNEIGSAIEAATRKPRTEPVVPGTMAGYSGTPLPKKLGIREKYSVVLVNAPERFERKLEPLPAGAGIADAAKRANVAVLFLTSQAELGRDFRPLAKALPEKVAFWIAWPKKTSGVRTDLSENVIREFGLGAGWVDYKVCAIDGIWSGLCFSRRKK